MKTILILLIAMITGNNSDKEKWSNSIKNSDNSEYVIEVAFNLDIPVTEVTQEQFNARYLINNH